MELRTLSLLPPKYRWLADVDGLPKTLLVGLSLLGTLEKVGPASNPVILDWAKDLGIAYTDDSVPWCGLFAAIVAKRAGKTVVDKPLWARDWLHFGAPRAVPGLGDVLVFSRPGGGGHVGFYVGEDKTHFHVLGGNQSDSVSIVRIDKDRLLGIRRPIYSTAQPAGVQRRMLEAAGTPSTVNEA